jgi:hypothetical protein
VQLALAQYRLHKASNSMSERQRQIEFLKSLVGFGDTAIYRQVEQKLHQAQQNENSVRRKIAALVVLALISCAGLSYTAMFVPATFEFTIPTLAKLFSVLGLGSLICLLIYVAYWLWYRLLLNSVQAECRKLIQRLFQNRMTPQEMETHFVAKD